MPQWLEKVYIYAALAGTDTLQEARELLCEQDILVSIRQLEMYQRRSGHRIEQAAQQQLSERLFGLFSYDLYERLNTLARQIEQRLCESQWEEKSELDLMDRYLKLMKLLSDIESDPEPAAGEDEAEDRIEEIFERLERAKDTENIRKQLRQAAAATGSSLKAPEESGAHQSV